MKILTHFSVAQCKFRKHCLFGRVLPTRQGAGALTLHGFHTLWDEQTPTAEYKGATLLKGDLSIDITFGLIYLAGH